MANLKAVLQRPKVAEKYARNAFDRSFSVNTTYQVGGLDVFFAEPFIAGSHVKLNRAIFQRTKMVNTAAFPKVDTHCEFFAVPLRLLWSYWNNYKLNIQDFNSDLLGTITASTDTFTPAAPAMPYFDLHDFLKDVNEAFTSAPQNSVYFPTATTRERDRIGAYRLLGALGYGQYPPKYFGDTDSTVFAVNPLKALAYQKVYYDHFRNTAYEANNPIYYNMDDLNSASLMPTLRTGKLFTYRYVNYRKDYMQSIYPSLNYTVSQPSGIQWTVPNSVNFSNVIGTNTISAQNQNGGQVQLGFTGLSSYNSFTYGTVQQIRAAFALDKLMRASAYAPKHVKDQFEARYGVKGVESGNESVRIGAFMNDIIIQEVTNTAASLGQIGGKGVGYNGFGQDIEYTCKEDCIILGLIYSLPRAQYDATHVKNWNAKLNREDFFIPEYMDLGLQPFLQYENTFMNVQGTPAVLLPYWIGVNGQVGYKTRYSEYKSGIDINLGEFMSGGIYHDFAVHSNQDIGSLNYGAANANYFKVKPTDMDRIWAVSTDPANTATDCFITHIDVKCICNQNMSVHGQPSLGGMS